MRAFRELGGAFVVVCILALCWIVSQSWLVHEPIAEHFSRPTQSAPKAFAVEDHRTLAVSAPLPAKSDTSASDADQQIMFEWEEQNESCRGSTDEETIKFMCAKRERTSAVLRKRGWCWEYSDWRVLPTEYKWHRCDVRRPI